VSTQSGIPHVSASVLSPLLSSRLIPSRAFLNSPVIRHNLAPLTVFHYGEALLSMIHPVGVFAMYLPGLYWLIEQNLPDILALIFAEAEFHSDKNLRARMKKPVLHDGLPTNTDDESALSFRVKVFDGQVCGCR